MAGASRAFSVHPCGRGLPGAHQDEHWRQWLSEPSTVCWGDLRTIYCPSGIDPVTDAYQYDASPPKAKQSSLYTFLIYLNDDFKGGETTFFIPSVKEGILNAYPIKPIMGSVAVFPHGEAQDALLHEGTGVVEGAKYVIRTDVEYDVEPTVS